MIVKKQRRLQSREVVPLDVGLFSRKKDVGGGKGGLGGFYVICQFVNVKIEEYMYYRFCSNSVKRAKSEGKKSIIFYAGKVREIDSSIVHMTQNQFVKGTQD